MAFTELLMISSFILLSGCAPEASTIEVETISINDTNDTPDVEPALEKPQEPKQRPYEERAYEAKGLGIFDFNELSAGRCDLTIQQFEADIQETRKNVDELQEDLQDEFEDLRKAEEALQDAEETNDQDLIDDRRDDTKEQQVDVDNVEIDLRDMEELQDKQRIVLKEIERECLRLKAESGST